MRVCVACNPVFSFTDDFLGIYCLATLELTFLTLGYLIGVNMVIDGVGRIINWFQIRKYQQTTAWVLVSAILSFVFGIALLISDGMQLIVDVYIVYMAAIWLIILGVLRISHAMRVRKVHMVAGKIVEGARLGGHWWVALILGILLVVVGVISLFTPAALAQTIGMLMGISIILTGVNMIHLGSSSWML